MSKPPILVVQRAWTFFSVILFDCPPHSDLSPVLRRLFLVPTNHFSLLFRPIICLFLSHVWVTRTHAILIRALLNHEFTRIFFEFIILRKSHEFTWTFLKYIIITNSRELFSNLSYRGKSRIPGNFSQIYYYREFSRIFLKSIISREVTDSREYFVELIESRKLQEHQRTNVIFLRMFSFWNTLVELDPDAVIFDILRPRMTSSHLDFIDISR